MQTWISFASFSDELNKLAEKHHEKTEKKIPLHKADHHIFEMLRKGSPVKVHITDEAHQFGGGFFDQVKKEIGLSEKSYETLAHELGHAHVDKHLLGQLIQSRAFRIASNPVSQILTGIGAGLLLAKGHKWGLLLPTALAAPTVLSEALASRKGGKLIEEAGGTEEQQDRYRKRMREGMMSYLLAPALASLVASVR